MKPKHQRFIFIIVAIGLLAGSVGLVLNNFNDNLVFFYSPTDLQNKSLKNLIRIGGLIEEGSVQKPDSGVTQFVITDLKNSVIVVYKGILPALFREGQGMVAKGKIGDDGVFKADELLAKHDENYMPPEVAKALEKSGYVTEAK